MSAPFVIILHVEQTIVVFGISLSQPIQAEGVEYLLSCIFSSGNDILHQ